MTVFNHFCGGVSELDCNPVIKKMYDKRVSSVLDFSTEAFNSEIEFDNCYDKKISIIEFVKDRKEIPFAVLKKNMQNLDLFKKVYYTRRFKLQRTNILWNRVLQRFEGCMSKGL